ncbi:MAG: hypothetical protein V1874_12105 [Spirochaetota bacterium]
MKTKVKLNLTVFIIACLMFGCSHSDDKESSSLPGSPTPPVISTFFDYETDREGWYSENTTMMTVTHNTIAEYVFHGSGSVKGECNITGTDPVEARILFRKNYTTAIDMTGLTLQFYVHIPDSLAGLSLKYGSGLLLGLGIDSYTGWAKMEGPEISTAGWNQFTFTPSGIGEEMVRAIAFKIYKNDGDEADWAGDIYFDYISW